MLKSVTVKPKHQKDLKKSLIKKDSIAMKKDPNQPLSLKEKQCGSLKELYSRIIEFTKTDMIDAQGNTVLHLLLKPQFYNADVNILEMIRKLNHFANVSNHNNETPFYLALTQERLNKKEIINTLLQFKIDMKHTSGDETYLLTAFSNSYFDENFIESFINRDGNLLVTDKVGNNALHIYLASNKSVTKGLKMLVRYFVKMKGDLTDISNKAKNVLELIISNLDQSGTIKDYSCNSYIKTEVFPFFVKGKRPFVNGFRVTSILDVEIQLSTAGIHPTLSLKNNCMQNWIDNCQRLVDLLSIFCDASKCKAWSKPLKYLMNQRNIKGVTSFKNWITKVLRKLEVQIPNNINAVITNLENLAPLIFDYTCIDLDQMIQSILRVFYNLEWKKHFSMINEWYEGFTFSLNPLSERITKLIQCKKGLFTKCSNHPASMIIDYLGITFKPIKINDLVYEPGNEIIIKQFSKVEQIKDNIKEFMKLELSKQQSVLGAIIMPLIKRNADQGVVHFILGKFLKLTSPQILKHIEYPKQFKAQLESFMEQADADELCGIAGMYAKGQGIERDYVESMKWYFKAANKGHAIADYNIGFNYLYGQGIPANFEEAMTWFKKAADKGLVPAIIAIGRCYLYGKGVTKNPEKALTWFRMAADKGSADAYENIGEVYIRKGASYENGYEKALKMFETAVGIGGNYYQFGIDDMYYRGYGVPIDYYKAFECFLQAANHGNHRAYPRVASMYFEGKGVKMNYKDALKWYRKAAIRGDRSANYALATMYREGKGCEINHVLAATFQRQAELNL